jgi:MFS family permease
MISIGAVNAVLFTPGLVQVATYFNVSQATAEWSLTAYLLGSALGQLPYGPFSNQYGRKKVLFIGVTILIISSFICILAGYYQTFWLFVLARFILAMGASVGLMMTFTLVSDVYPLSAATKVISQLVIAFAVAPYLAIAVGGFLVHHFHWEACFYFSILYGFILLVLFRYFLPIDFIDKKMDATPKVIFKKFLHQFRYGSLLGLGIIMGSIAGTGYVFAAKAPVLCLTILKLTPQEFGIINLIPMFGMIAGSLYSAKVATIWPPKKAIIFGLIIALASVAFMLYGLAFFDLAVWNLFVPMIGLFFGLTFVYANASSVILGHAQDKASASSIANFLNMFVAGTALLTTSFFNPADRLVLPLALTALCLVIVFMLILLRKCFK